MKLIKTQHYQEQLNLYKPLALQRNYPIWFELWGSDYLVEFEYVPNQE